MHTGYPIYFVEGVVAVAALALLFVRNLFIAALLVLTILVSLSGLYLLLGAEFVAVTQLLVYAGGILVVVMFGIMLTGQNSRRPLQVAPGNLWTALIIGLPLLAALVILYSRAEFATMDIGVGNFLPAIGRAVMTDFLLPFEIAGLLLLVALIGAAVITNPSGHESD